jgi:large subunit ribosomal protein L30
MSAKKLTITQVRSSNGSSKRQRDTLRTLGVGRIGKSAEVAENEAVRGQIHAVAHLLEVK